MIVRFFLFYVITITFTGCISKTEKASTNVCLRVRLDAIDTLVALDQLKQNWSYSYSFTADSCFVIDDDIFPTDYHFFECNPPDSEAPIAETSLKFTPPRFRKICFRDFDQYGDYADTINYAFTSFHQGVLHIDYYGNYHKDSFYIRHISKDTLVTELERSFPDNQGKYLKRPSHLYLRRH